MQSRLIFPPGAAAATAAFGVLSLLSGAASAHIHLLEPTPRYPDEVAGENKNCPCGVGSGGRTCSKPEERSDPDRSTDRATTLVGGSLITVRLSEYVGHSGRYRIAFDPEGADVADFNQHILTDIPDPDGNRGNSGNGSLWEISARLPNIDCENCTLQIVQVMNGDTENPVADTVGQSTYYQCADLVLTKDPNLPEGYAAPLIVQDVPAVETGGAANGDTANGADAGGTPTSAPTATETGGTPVPTSGPTDPSSAPISESGCSLGSVAGSGGWAPAWLLAAVAALGVMRARRARCS